MNATELSEKYMEKYQDLIFDFKNEHIEDIVNDLNLSIKKADMVQTNIFYNQLMNWNTRVSNLVGVRLALNVQFSHLHLPSPALYSVVFDGEERIWRFNTEAN